MIRATAVSGLTPGALRPNAGEKGEYGNQTVSTNAAPPSITKRNEGMLFRNGFVVRTRKIIAISVITDSRNHPD